MSSRITNLHVECKKYHFKKYMKVVLTLIAIIILPLGAFFLNEYLNSDKVISKLDRSLVKKEEPKELVKEVEVNQTVAVAKVEIKEDKVQEPKTSKYAVAVSTDKLEESILNATKKQKTKKVRPKKITKVLAPAKETVIILNPVKEEKVVLKTAPIKDRKKYFEDSDREHKIESWIQKYEDKKTYALAIYISSYYYKRKDFKLSGIWARRANKLDRDKEKAWLLYAKSMYALGNKRKAKGILNIFMQYRESAKAEILLSEWED